MERFDELVIEEIPRLRRYARALTGDAVRADDLVQDCLERAWSRRFLWIRHRGIRPWLFTIMHNIFVNDIKRQKVAAKLMTAGDPEDLPGAHEPATSYLEIRDLDAALQQLPPDQRAAILLVGLEELRYRDAAGVLGVPIGTLMSRLSRGRARLRELLADDGKSSLRRVK
jgi:RNA polymerase sigma-70 factor (ECF subfamily)